MPAKKKLLEELNAKIHIACRDLGVALPEKDFTDVFKAEAYYEQLVRSLIEQRKKLKVLTSQDNQGRAVEPKDKILCICGCGTELQKGKYCHKSYLAVKRWTNFVMRNSADGRPVPTHPFLNHYDSRIDENKHETVVCPVCSKTWKTCGVNPIHPLCFERLSLKQKETICSIAKQTDKSKSKLRVAIKEKVKGMSIKPVSGISIKKTAIKQSFHGVKHKLTDAGIKFSFPSEIAFECWYTNPLNILYRKHVSNWLIPHFVDYLKESQKKIDAAIDDGTRYTVGVDLWKDYVMRRLKSLDIQIPEEFVKTSDDKLKPSKAATEKMKSLADIGVEKPVQEQKPEQTFPNIINDLMINVANVCNQKGAQFYFEVISNGLRFSISTVDEKEKINGEEKRISRTCKCQGKD